MTNESIITFSTGVEVLQTSPKNKEHSDVFRSMVKNLSEKSEQIELREEN